MRLRYEFFHNRITDKRERIINDQILGKEIDLLNAKKLSLTAEEKAYLKAFQHIDSFHRPLWPFLSSMSDRDLLICYFLRPNFPLYLQPSKKNRPARPASADVLKEYIKQRTYCFHNVFDVASSLITWIIIPIFTTMLIGGLICSAPMGYSVAMLCGTLFSSLISYVLYNVKNRDTSAYLERLRPYAAEVAHTPFYLGPISNIPPVVNAEAYGPEVSCDIEDPILAMPLYESPEETPEACMPRTTAYRYP